MTLSESRAAALMAVLDLEEREPDVFVGQTPTTGIQRIFGGQVAGQALMAAEHTVPAERAVHSLHSYFLRPGDPDEEIRYAVERIRDGRTFSTRRVMARQWRGGKDVEIFALTADFHAGERAVAEHALPMPEVPAPEDLAGLEEWAAKASASPPPAVRALAAVVEQRPLEDPFAPRAKTWPDTKTRLWLRVSGSLPADAAVHAAGLTFASDLTLLSAGLARLGTGWAGVVGSSLDHAVWFHRPVQADDWFLYETDSPSASSGRAFCLGQIWAKDGTHVATVAQEGLIRSLSD
jgi:acyl-CoA thioesterase-2